MMGDRETAIRCYRDVLALQRGQPHSAAIGQTLINLGNVHADSGRPEQARAYYLEALDMLKPLDDHRALGVLYSNLAGASMRPL